MGESLFLVSTSILWPQFISPLDVLLQRPTANSFSQPGCHLPWRVIHLDSSKTKLPKPSADPTVYVVNQQPISKTPKSRKKPGKKRRIVLRKRAAAERRKRKPRQRSAPGGTARRRSSGDRGRGKERWLSLLLPPPRRMVREALLRTLVSTRKVTMLPR